MNNITFNEELCQHVREGKLAIENTDYSRVEELLQHIFGEDKKVFSMPYYESVDGEWYGLYKSTLPVIPVKSFFTPTAAMGKGYSEGDRLELEEAFTHAFKEWYLNCPQDRVPDYFELEEISKKAVTNFLSSLPPASIEPYIKAQSSTPVQYTPCGGCGAQTPNERCINCFHDFTPVLEDKPFCQCSFTTFYENENGEKICPKCGELVNPDKTKGNGLHR